MKKKIIKYLTKVILWLKSKEPQHGLPLISLAPKILTQEKDIKIIQPYLDELERSLAEDKLTNIAVTGTYGSGKSTIIKTFQHLHPEYKYLNISLASFQDNEENGKKQINGNVDNKLERRLEISILQQIFYHVKPSEIPDSRFKRIRNIKGWKLLFISLSLIVWLISTFILFKFDYINKIDPSTWDFSLKFDWIAFISCVIFFTGIGLFTKYIVRLFSNSKINKFSIKGELELGNNIDKSVFNEHLEEIIYFFERIPYDVVVIEDLDRFDTTDIFTKLRELNILLNTSKLIKRKRGISFVYAIKDELFTDKNDRVKFFDYIIPIIPFINASNAGVKLNDLINTRQLENVLTSDFIQDIVSFIDDIDMRLLINIFHEFCIYRKNISAEIQDNLFAMIVYKNMYPDDFGKLSKREGNLYDFISKKNNYTNDTIIKIDNQIKIKKEQIENINGEKITSEKELRAIYINAIHERIPDAVYLFDEKLTFAVLSEDKHFEKVKNATNILYYYYRSNYFYTNSSNIGFSEIENHVNPKSSYDKRKQLIQEKHENKVDQIKKEIESLINDKKEIEQKSLREIFQEIDIEQYLGVFSKNQMIRTLLINGYINEDYEDYIALFHEGNITRADETFKRKIKSGIISAFDYPLSEKIGNLVKEIPDKYFKREVILNFDLLDFLSVNYNQNKSKYQEILRTLSNEKNSSIRFIVEYIEREKNIPLFVKSLCHSWNNWWDFMYNSDNAYFFNDDILKKYLKLIIEHAETNDIVLMNNNYGLSEFINILPDFISLIDKSYDSKTKSIIKKLEIKFEQIEVPPEGTETLFNYIYENNLYEINEENIYLMLRTYYKDVDEKELKESHYSTILKSNCTPLLEYIESNISVYVKDVLLRLKENTKEEEEIIIKLLNHTALNDVVKTEIALKQETLINDISDIESTEIQQMLIESNKITVSWNNLYLYYETLEEGSDLDETLINFLNKAENYTLLTKQTIEDELSEYIEKVIENFSLKIIYCNELKYKSYISLLKSITPTLYKLHSLDFEQLDEDKVKWMIDTGFLILTANNFNKLKENFPNDHIKLVEKQQNNFFSKFEELTLDKDDVLNLLKSKEFTNDSKVKLIEQIDSDFITENKDIAKITCDILASDSNYILLDIDVIKSLINSSSLRENKIKVLNKQEEELNNSQIQNLIETFGGNYEKLFIKQSKPKFSETDYHKQLFDILINRGLIKRYELCKDNQLKVIANY